MTRDQGTRIDADLKTGLFSINLLSDPAFIRGVSSGVIRVPTSASHHSVGMRGLRW
jgi:hypothetical protein